MSKLEERCRKIWKEEFNIEDKKIDWLINSLTEDAKNNNNLITDDQIRLGKCHLLWQGLAEAVLGYIAWCESQY
jgi:hypothetical protein